MVSLDAVRASNRGLKTAMPGITALFVGGTTGMGQSTLRHLAENCEKPNAYIIGRSEANAKSLLAELRNINPLGTFSFIEADVSLICNVDKACDEIKKNETKLNVLFMTVGGIHLLGRRDTAEGLDNLFALRYYSRMRFVQNMLPLLEEGNGRVVSIFGGGFEGNIDPDNLDLKTNYNVLTCAMHSVTMASLAMEYLAASSKKVSFVHCFPGIVGTNIYTNSFPAPIAAIYNYGMWPLMYPFSVNLSESGERHLYHATSASYPSLSGSISKPAPSQVALGSDNKPGSGAYLINWKGDASAGNKTMQKYRQDGTQEAVWKHTVELLQKAASRQDM